jgi:hypothetical protein
LEKENELRWGTSKGILVLSVILLFYFLIKGQIARNIMTTEQ